MLYWESIRYWRQLAQSVADSGVSIVLWSSVDDATLMRHLGSTSKNDSERDWSSMRGQELCWRLCLRFLKRLWNYFSQNIKLALKFGFSFFSLCGTKGIRWWDCGTSSKAIIFSRNSVFFQSCEITPQIVITVGQFPFLYRTTIWATYSWLVRKFQHFKHFTCPTAYPGAILQSSRLLLLVLWCYSWVQCGVQSRLAVVAHDSCHHWLHKVEECQRKHGKKKVWTSNLNNRLLLLTRLKRACHLPRSTLRGRQFLWSWPIVSGYSMMFWDTFGSMTST